MPKITLTSVGIAGSGEASDETLAALLDDQLPQKLGAVYRPNRMPRHLRALHSARAWLESPDVLGENGTVGTDDLIASLLVRREGDGTEENPGGDTVELYILWPEEPSEDELALVKAAFDNDIRVRNLSAMLQDLDPDEIFPPEPEPEPTPAEAAADEAAEKLGLEDKVARPAAERTPNLALLDAMATYVTTLVYDILRNEGLLGNAKAEAIAEKVTATVKAETPPFDPPYLEPLGKDGKPLGSPEKAPGKIKYFYDPTKDSYRVAKFRPKTGEETVYLSEEEVGQVVRAGLVAE